MRKVVLSVIAATALSAAGAANASVTIKAGGTYSDPGSTIVVGTPDNTKIPNKVAFDTFTDTAGTYVSSFDFTEDMNSTAIFTLTSAEGVITLAQLIDGVMTPTTTVIGSSLGTGKFLELDTGLLMAGNTYRFSYSSTLPTGGGDISGNVGFYAAAVPEPATWAMMLLGFGGIGMAMRRRRKPVLAQVA